MRKFKKVVDERQELELLKIEHICFWVTYWVLGISFLVQAVFMDAPFKQYAAEWIIFLASSIGITIGCIKKGQWDFYADPSIKGYLITSTITTVLIGIFYAVVKYHQFEHFRNNLLDLIIFTLIASICTFVAVFSILFLLGTVIKRRRNKLEREYEDNE